MRLSYVLIGFILFILCSGNLASGKESRPAFRFATGKSDYTYFAECQNCPSGQTGVKMPFRQVDIEVGMETPKKYLGDIVYIGLSVNTVTLTQDEQEVNDGSTYSIAEVPEKAFLHTRELYGTIGTDFGNFFIDFSAGWISVKGNYYINNIRYATEKTYQLLKLSGILEFDLFSWGKYGAGYGVSVNPSGNDGTNYEYIEYKKATIFIKILL